MTGRASGRDGTGAAARVGAAVVAGFLLAIGLAGPAAAQPLADTRWRAVMLEDRELPRWPRVEIRFDEDGRVSGHGGCNDVLGTYARDGTTIAITPRRAAQESCQPAANRIERNVLDALAEATTARAPEAGRMVLRDADGEKRMELVRIADDPLE